MTRTIRRAAVLGALLLAGGAAHAHAGELRGSPQSMQRQHGVAVEHGYDFVSTTAEVQELVARGKLVRLADNGFYDLTRVSWPYALPEMRTFLERLGRQYFEANGEPLVVTSLLRPSSRQPRNAHELSVHPVGMAVDLRVPRDGTARSWLEKTLLSLEDEGVLDVTRERYPPHYHVALYPEAYGIYAAERTAEEEVLAAREAYATSPLGAAGADAVSAEQAGVVDARGFGWWGLTPLVLFMMALAAPQAQRVLARVRERRPR